MNLVPTVPAALAAPFLFLVPGLVLLALIPPRDRDALHPDEALFLAVATSLAGSAWVGLVLAELGRFSLTTAAAILAGLSLAAAVAGRRHLARPLRAPGTSHDWAAALAVLALALVLEARPSQYIVGGRDPGAYVGAMGLIARTHGIVFADPAVLSIPPEDVGLFYRNPAGPPFSWARFLGFDLESPRTGRVVPEFFHLFPAFGAYLFQAMGIKGALATPPLFGVLGTLAAYFTFRRLFGPPPALLAAFLLEINIIQIWFARYPVSETVSQFLVFLGLLAFVHWEERGSTAFGLLSGGALGLSLLVRVDSVLIGVPLGLSVLLRRMRGDLPWRAVLPVIAPFGLLGLHAALHAALFARKYLLAIATRRYWHQPPVVWIVAAAVAVSALVLAPRGKRLVARLEEQGEALRAALMAALVALALYAYFMRPVLSAWAGGDGNDRAQVLAGPWLLHALGFRRLAAHDAQALVRFAWFVTPLGLATGLCGLLLVLREWRPRYLLPVLTALTFSFFYFYKVRVWNDYPFALRRFFPVVLPCVLAFAAYFLCRMAARGGALRVASGGVAAVLAVLFLRDTAPLVRYVDWAGSVDFVRDVARRFGPEDLVIFEQPKSIHLLSLPLWALHGVRILELARFNPDPDRLSHALTHWRGEYRNIYFVHTYRTDLCGVFLERVQSFASPSFEWAKYDRRPDRPEFRSLHFTLSRVVPPEELHVPPLPEVDIGGTDDVQVSGFFDKEGGEGLTYRWTGACASVYLPGAHPGARLLIRASKGRRPTPAIVHVSFSGAALGTFVADPAWNDCEFVLPSPLPQGPPVLRLDVRPWKPANLSPLETDTRELGVMVDRVSVVTVQGVRHSPSGGGGAAHASMPVSAPGGGVR